MNKQFQLTFYRADFAQYSCILGDEEIREKIASFLLKYVSIEAFYKKMLIAEMERDGKKISPKDRKHLNVKTVDVRRVMRYFDVIIDDRLIERVFGSNDKSYMKCSVKKLRDRLVHNVNNNVLQCVLERYDTINMDLDAFLDALSA